MGGWIATPEHHVEMKFATRSIETKEYSNLTEKKKLWQREFIQANLGILTDERRNQSRAEGYSTHSTTPRAEGRWGDGGKGTPGRRRGHEAAPRRDSALGLLYIGVQSSVAATVASGGACLFLA
jgi:hypothetical protein